MAQKTRNAKELRNVVKKTLTFEDYKNCLFNDSTEYKSQLMFQSIKHEIFMLKVNKVTLNRDDDKRISKKDRISTLARGHQALGGASRAGEWPMRPLGRRTP